MACGLLVAVLGMPAAAAAQDTWGQPAEPVGHIGGGPPAAGAESPGRLWADFAFHTQKNEGQRTSSLSWTLNGRYAADGFGAELSLPLSYIKSESSFEGDIKSFMVGNLTLSALFVQDMGGTHVEVGALIGLPTNKDPDDGGDVASLIIASAVRGLWDVWLWSPEQVALAIPARLEHIGGGFGVGIDTALGISIGIDQLSDSDPVGLFQIQGWGGYASQAARAGLKVTSATLFGPGDPEQQASIGPFVELHGDGAFGGAEALINLDEPYGYVDNGAEIWGIRLYAGAKL